MNQQFIETLRLYHKLFKSHPWHGVSVGKDAPEIVTVYVEIVPADTIKYETDKESGILSIDRPQKYSNICPAIYGFVPQTLCLERVAEHCMKRSGLKNIIGDNDPIDICVLSERHIPHGDILLSARPIGGFRFIDKGEADDKIIAVLDGDLLYKDWTDITNCPKTLLDRLQHYFLTYKLAPGAATNSSRIEGIYGAEEAREIIKRSQEDYKAKYPDLVEAMRGICEE
jgi:inorganic pyrophosphatase